MRAAALIIALLAIGVASEGTEHHGKRRRHQLRGGAAEALRKLGQDIEAHHREALEHPRRAWRRQHGRGRGHAGGVGAGGADTPALDPPLAAPTKRRLLTATEGTVQDFIADILGSNWEDHVPEFWTDPSFDFGKLGQFDFSSNLRDFLAQQKGRNISDIKNVKGLLQTVEDIENTFCTEEDFSKGDWVPAACTGPTISIGITARSCTVDPKKKEIACRPAKLVLTKTPGSCVSKYKAASSWTGKECKISGGVGFSDEFSLGGFQRVIDLKNRFLHHKRTCQRANFTVPVGSPTTSLALPAEDYTGKACQGAALLLGQPTLAAGCTGFTPSFVTDAAGVALLASPGCSASAGIPYRAGIFANTNITVTSLEIGSLTGTPGTAVLRLSRPNGSFIDVSPTAAGTLQLPPPGFAIAAGTSGYSLELLGVGNPATALSIKIKRFSS